MAAIDGREAAGGAEVTPAEAVAYAIAHCSEKLSVIPERELQRVALLTAWAASRSEQIEAELPRQGVITEEIDGRRMATTRSCRPRRTTSPAWRRAAAARLRRSACAEGLDRTLPDGKPLNDGQWQAVTGLLNRRTASTWWRGRPVRASRRCSPNTTKAMRLAGQDGHLSRHHGQGGGGAARGRFRRRNRRPFPGR